MTSCKSRYAKANVNFLRMQSIGKDYTGGIFNGENVIENVAVHVQLESLIAEFEWLT